MGVHWKVLCLKPIQSMWTIEAQWVCVLVAFLVRSWQYSFSVLKNTEACACWHWGCEWAYVYGHNLHHVPDSIFVVDEVCQLPSRKWGIKKKKLVMENRQAVTIALCLSLFSPSQKLRTFNRWQYTTSDSHRKLRTFNGWQYAICASRRGSTHLILYHEAPEGEHG